MHAVVCLKLLMVGAAAMTARAATASCDGDIGSTGVGMPFGKGITWSTPYADDKIFTAHPAEFEKFQRAPNASHDTFTYDSTTWTVSSPPNPPRSANTDWHAWYVL